MRRVPAFNLDRLELDSSAVGSLTLASGLAMPKKSYRVFAALHYQHNPLWLTIDDATTARVVSDRLALHLGGAYAIFEGFEIGLQIPVVLYQGGGDVAAVGLVPVDTSGFGAPVLSARYAFLRRSAGMPFDMALDLGLPIPIGSNNALANDPGFGLSPKLSAGVAASSLLRLSAELGARIRPYTPMGARALGSEFNWGVGGTVSLDKLRLELALKSAVSFVNAPAGFELLGGARYSIGDFELFLLGGPGLGTAPGTPAFRLLLGGAWGPATPRAKPAPKTFPDAQPEDRKAPAVVAPAVVAAAEPCVEGRPYEVARCPDLDKDGDSLANGVDACPTEAEDKDGYQDQDGCPEPDNDGDGVLDVNDACPNEAGPGERKGCPVRDADQDGLEDSADACPNEAGVPELRGCPPKDTDQDGVLDELDNCPKEPGPKENQGCPAKKKQLVVITREKLIIKDKVFFNTAKSTIQKRSNVLLDQIASVLIEHPELKLVHIEGHTDSTGSAETNRKLSQARAAAVRDYLMKKGVTPDRLKAFGHGPDRPADTNNTPAGREANRRVEFLIADQAAQETRQTIDEDLAPLAPKTDEKQQGVKP